MSLDIWMILRILSLKNHHLGHFLLKNSHIFTKLVVLVSKIHQNIYFIVPQIDHPVALCNTTIVVGRKGEKRDLFMILASLN